MMSGSPYHLNPSAGRRSNEQLLGSSAAAAATATMSAAGSSYISKPRPHHESYGRSMSSHFALSVDSTSNPLVQAQLGTYASQYAGARSLALHHHMEEDFTTRRSAHIGSGATGGGSWSHLHPLQQQAMSSASKQGASRSSIPHMIQSQLSPPQGLTASLWANLGNQFVRVASALHQQQDSSQQQQQQQPQDDGDFGFHQSSSSTKQQQPPLVAKLRKLAPFALPVLALALISQTGLLPGRGRWKRLEKRKLHGRQCVMNLFVDKQAKDEFNPDYVADPAKAAAVNVTVNGTYRTKGQLKVIGRFMSAVADSFRSNVDLEQHVIFTGSRDNGHLAEEAIHLWPPRGSYRTQLHVIAAESHDAIHHEFLGGLEDRFKKKGKHIHLYDHIGRQVGKTSEEDDDEGDREAEEDEEDGEAKKDKDPKADYESEDGEGGELPMLQKLLFPEMDSDKAKKRKKDDEEEEDDEEKADIVIPYMHIDGKSMKDQMELLNKASSLLESKTVVVVGMEHSPDMKIDEVIDFFRQLQYKTFMLGVRQLTRIDNLCPEVLDNTMSHPNLKVKKSGLLAGAKPEDSPYPPFFVFMPKSRRSKEEMTVQHMYDLFSGSGGGGQVKTANDRKAPGK